MAKKNSIVLVDESYLKDFDGSDAMALPQDEIKAKVQHVATASLPTLLERAIQIVKTSDSEKSVIEAMKFIRSLSEGETKAKQVEGMARKLTDEQLLNTLDGQYEDVE
jgi:hypothetical protein